jgi:acyl-CoA thioester hydrolase
MANFFELPHKVAPEEIDGLGHVNNLVYLGWFLDAATGHTEAAGLSVKSMLEEGEGWVVRRHEIDYLAQVRPGDSVVVRTWIETAEKVSSVRRYEISNASDGRLVCKGLTVWVWINYRTGKPSRIPEKIYAAYGVEPGKTAVRPGI